jgi:hypothetical protein
MTEQAKGERQTFAECPYCGRSLPEPVFSAHLGLAHQLTPPPAEAKASASTEPAKAKDCRCASVMDGRGGMCPAHPFEPAPGPDERSETGALNTAKGGEGLERIRKALEQDRIGHAAFHDTQPDSFCCSPMANGIASELLRLIEALTRGAKEWNYNDPGGANE